MLEFEQGLQRNIEAYGGKWAAPNFQALLQNLFGGIEKNHKNLSQVSLN
jgi:hypothetical protein